MVRLLARVIGVGVETADMLVNESFAATAGSTPIARYAGLTGAPDETGPSTPREEDWRAPATPACAAA